MICTHVWACTQQLRGRRHDASLRRSSGLVDRRNPRLDCTPSPMTATQGLLAADRRRGERAQAVWFSFERDRVRFIQEHGMVG
jgi:hypothetical protein